MKKFLTVLVLALLATVAAGDETSTPDVQSCASRPTRAERKAAIHRENLRTDAAALKTVLEALGKYRTNHPDDDVRLAVTGTFSSSKTRRIKGGLEIPTLLAPELSSGNAAFSSGKSGTRGMAFSLSIEPSACEPAPPECAEGTP